MDINFLDLRLVTEYIPLSDIKPYANNAKKHPDDQVDQIMQSVRQFGMDDPIGIWGPDNLIVEGHGRWMACKKLGIKTVLVVRLDHLSEKQRKAYALVHNKLTMNTDFDLEVLEAELNAIEDIDMSDFGFEEFDELTSDDVEEDEIPDKIPDDISFDDIRRGDVWQLGRHRLMCGDSTDPGDVERLMNGEEAHLLLTDPPYNVAYEADSGETVTNDDMNEEAFEGFLRDAMANAYDFMVPGAAFYVWHADSNGLVFRQVCEETGLQVRQCLIWVKNTFTFGRQDYQWQHEPCLYGWKEGAAHYFVNDHTMATIIMDDTIDSGVMKKAELLDFTNKLLESIRTSVIFEHKPLKNDLHPTMKPVKIFARLVYNSTRGGENVLDPFGGSGTAIIACEQLNRACYTMEIEPKWCDVIIRRWERLTGQTAIRL